MDEERKRWLLVGVLFLTTFFVIGCASAITGVFLTPLVAQFGWSRTRVASLTTLISLTAALAGPFVGRLLDSVAARKVMSAGIVLTAGALVMAGRAESFRTMAAAHILIGLGTSAATALPASLVISNWFGASRGVALGVAFSGMSLGGSAMAPVASHLIATAGWRWAYSSVAVPLLVLVLPLVVLVVRNRPSVAMERIDSARVDPSQGWERRAAVRSRSFWLIAVASYLHLTAAGIGVVHLIPHLIGVGLKPQNAALIYSAILVISTLGKPSMGFVADRLDVRLALALGLISFACAFLLLTQAAYSFTLAPLVFFYGIGVGTPLALFPMLTAESFGLKNYGSIAGLIGLVSAMGSATGPIIVGRIFDITGAYTLAFVLSAAALLIASLLPFGCVSFKASDLESSAAAIQFSPAGR
jgi:predicted MFS family arabinose efflux permease